MKTIQADIFTGEWDAIGHCVNLYHTWGAGIVVPLKKKYPQAFLADKATPYGDSKKLGFFSFADFEEKRIYNLYAQVGIGNDGKPLNRNCQYDFLFDSLYQACEHLVEDPVVEKEKYVFALPYLIGCGLASGKEKIVLAIIEEVEKCFPKVEFNLYKL